MLTITYVQLWAAISAIWCLVRGAAALRTRKVCWKREAQLLLVYVCIVVAARFTFFPFEKADGVIQPLVFDVDRLLPLRINLTPLVSLTDYDHARDALRNAFGNTAMFIPMGIVWPVVFRQLNNTRRAMAAGAGFSLCIELMQLPFPDRVTDIDDLLLNTSGFAIGYGVYRIARKIHTVRKGKTNGVQN